MACFRPFRHPAAALLAAGLLLPAAAAWPQYRGPQHDGSTPETLRTNWTARPPVLVWKRPLEPGWSSPVVADGRVFTQLRRFARGGQREFAVALNAATGQELWAREVDDASYDNLAGYDDNLDGPRSTPSVDGDRVYVFTSHLKLLALRADNGAVLWQRDFMAEPPGTSVIAWQNAASPLVMGDFIYVNGNVPGQRLAAVRKADGVTAWARHDLGMTHATPAWAVIAGAPQVVFVTAQGLAGLAPASGDVLWRYVFTPSSTSTAVTPVVAGDRVYASAAYGRGSWNARIVPAGGAFSAVETQYRQATEFQNHWATPVHHEGVLYGIVERGAPARSLVCYDLAGRTNRWRTTAVGSGSPGFGSVIKAGGLLLVLTEEGELVLVQPDPERYVELGRFPLLTRHCWNNPAFSGGRLYARSSAELAALDLAPEAAPLPPLAVSAGLAGEPRALRFSVTGQDRPLPADAAGRLELASTSALPAADAAWTPVTAAFTVQDGVAEASVPLPGGDTFFRVRTRP